MLAAYRSLEAAGDAVSRIVRSGLLPGAMEIMDHLAIQAAEAAVHAGYPLDAAAVLLVELEGEAADIDAQFVDLEALIRASGAYQVRIAQNAAERLAMWKGRKSAFSAVGRLSPDFIVQDGVVPRSRLGEALVGIEAIGRKHGIRVANVFHAGDGNLHPLILFDGRDRRRARSRRGVRRGDPAPVHRARRIDHRRARRRPREARLPRRACTARRTSPA